MTLNLPCISAPQGHGCKDLQRTLDFNQLHKFGLNDFFANRSIKNLTQIQVSL